MSRVSSGYEAARHDQRRMRLEDKRDFIERFLQEPKRLINPHGWSSSTRAERMRDPKNAPEASAGLSASEYTLKRLEEKIEEGEKILARERFSNKQSRVLDATEILRITEKVITSKLLQENQQEADISNDEKARVFNHLSKNQVMIALKQETLLRGLEFSLEKLKKTSVTPAELLQQYVATCQNLATRQNVISEKTRTFRNKALQNEQPATEEQLLLLKKISEQQSDIITEATELRRNIHPYELEETNAQR